MSTKRYGNRSRSCAPASSPGSPVHPLGGMGIDPGGFPDTQLRHYVQHCLERPKVQAPPTSRQLSRHSNVAGRRIGTHPVFRWEGLYPVVLYADSRFSKPANGVLRRQGTSRTWLQGPTIRETIYQLALPVCQGLCRRKYSADLNRTRDLPLVLATAWRMGVVNVSLERREHPVENAPMLMGVGRSVPDLIGISGSALARRYPVRHWMHAGVRIAPESTWSVGTKGCAVASTKVCSKRLVQDWEIVESG